MAACPFRPGLRARVDDIHVAEPQLARRPLEERALPPDALDERDPRLRQRDRQGQPWESAPRAEIGKVSCISDRVDLERDERIRDVDVNAPFGLADRRDGRRFGCDEVEKRRRSAVAPAGQAVAGCEFVETGLDGGRCHWADRKT